MYAKHSAFRLVSKLVCVRSYFVHFSLFLSFVNVNTYINITYDILMVLIEKDQEVEKNSNNTRLDWIGLNC